MGRTEREKGARGEREVAEIFRSVGLACDRTPNSGGLFIPGDLSFHAPLGLHVEVKRQERLCLPEWIRQAEADAKTGTVPLVAFRQNHGEWYGVLGLRYLAEVLARAHD